MLGNIQVLFRRWQAALKMVGVRIAAGACRIRKNYGTHLAVMIPFVQFFLQSYTDDI